MPHDTTLIATLAAAFVLALAFGFVAIRLRVPPLVGYLIAGIALGPFTPGIVADPNIAAQLAEIGVILLMFGVGLHFSFRDLAEMRRVALPGAVAQIVTATAMGAGLAMHWGWSLGAGLVFGLALSVASTVVLLRALEQRNALDSPEGHIAMGWLIIEDLVMVLVLVILPVLAEPRGGAEAGRDLVMPVAVVLGKVALFVALAALVGTRVVPWLLMQVTRTGSRELFTLAVLAGALGIAYGSAALFDVSLALGAFFAGVVLSESDLSQRAAADSLPLKDAFAVLFFVSVGMLFAPSILLREPLELLGVVLIILLGKSLVAFGIVRAFGYPAKTALTVSASLAQIGEFSFILAGLGAALGVLPAEGRDLILASAILSIALNPLAFAGIEPIAAWLERRGRTRGFAAASSAPLTASDPSHGAERDHVVVVGYGRVGGTIGPILEQARIPFVVIERDRRLVDGLRARGIRVLCADATADGMLEAAGIRRARVLVIATPDGFQARRVLELARALNSRIEIAVRTHSESELAYLQRAGVGFAVLGERELALAMAQYTLGRFGGAEAGAPPGAQ